MRTLLLGLVLVLAGCGTTSPVPPSATADVEGLRDYLANRGVGLFGAPGVDRGEVEGAEVAVYRLTSSAGAPAPRPQPRDADYRTLADVGLYSPMTTTRPRWPYPDGRVTVVRVYTFDGPADLGRIRDALGAGDLGSVAYVDGSMAVVTSRGTAGLNRLLLRAFGDPQTL